MSDKMHVVPMEEVQKELKPISDDILALREHVKNVEESTGLKLDENKDEQAKAAEALDGILQRQEKLETELHEAKQKALASSGVSAVHKELKNLQGGFEAPQGTDAEYRKVDAGTKPTVKQLVEGVRLPTGKFWTPQNEEVMELQELSDTVLITDALMAHAGGNSYRQAGGLKSLNCYKELMRRSEDLFKASTDYVDTDNISNWVPTHFSSQVFDIVKAGLPELNIFREITMPGKTFDLNVNLSDVSGDYLPETSTIAAADPFADVLMQSVDDAKATLTAAKFRARVMFSGESDEDSIVAQMQVLRDHIIEALREAKADAILNGDSDGAGLDTGDTHYGRANPPVNNDPRLAFDGLRTFLDDNTATPSVRTDISNASLSVANLRTMRKTMGEWGLEPSQLANLLSYNTYLDMLGDSELKTMDLVGDRATVIRGSIGMVNGSSVLVSRRMPLNMNASGVMDGVTTDRTSAIIVNRRGAIVGNRRRDTVGTDRYGATDSTDLFVFSRIGFIDLFGNAYPWLAEGYNIAT